MDDTLKGAIFAAEQVNAEGGILGKQVKIISEDTDATSLPFDASKVSLAVTKLITYHKVDFLIGGIGIQDNMIIQDIIAQHKIIFIGSNSPSDVLTERVKNDYEKYKYFFKVCPPSEDNLADGTLDSVLALREYSGFNKIAYIAQDSQIWDPYIENAIKPLTELYDFELVYGKRFPPDIVDFSSYLAGAEAAGAEIIIPVILGNQGIAFTKEWYDRQSPTVLWGAILAAATNDFWDITEGKCEHITYQSTPIDSGYPISSKTLPTLQALEERWEGTTSILAVEAYDIIRFILPDVLERAGTLETEPVIKAFENIDVETASTPHFAILADSHEIMAGPGFSEQFYFQWQANRQRVPVYPREIKEKEGVAYTFPPWFGPWNNIS
jgi:branched-chain amino acid transport system substrate-binding protein